jgi:hypothetical protein
MTPQLWSELEPLLEKAVHPTPGRPLQAKNFVAMWTLLQYIEEFFQRFDLNRDQTINPAESNVAFQVYDPTFAEMMGAWSTVSRGVRKSFFTYLFAYGESPLDGFGNSLSFVHWQWNESSWAYQATRVRLAQILSRLSAL